MKLVVEENHRNVKDDDKWCLAKSLTTHYKIIFPFLKNAVSGQIKGIFKPKRIPVTLTSLSRQKDIEGEKAEWCRETNSCILTFKFVL
jgi:hypothetical protein